MYGMLIAACLAAEPIDVATVHADAANEIAAEKLYGGQVLTYRLTLHDVQRVDGRYVMRGAVDGRTVAALTIAVGREGDFARFRPGDMVAVRAKYYGTAPQIGAVKGYVVLLTNAELVR